jgi:hypothetical protein
LDDSQFLYEPFILLFLRVNYPAHQVSNVVVKCAGLLAGLIAAVVLVSENTSPDEYIPLGLAVFIFGLMEAGMGVWREW